MLSLLAGSTVSKSAEVAGVTRETVHRWRRDPDFADQLAREQRDIRLQATALLTYVAKKAAANLAMHVARGDLGASLEVLKGLGLLGGRAAQNDDLLAPEVIVVQENFSLEDWEETFGSGPYLGS